MIWILCGPAAFRPATPNTRPPSTYRDRSTNFWSTNWASPSLSWRILATASTCSYAWIFLTTTAAGTLIQKCLEALAHRFSTDQVTVDVSNHNASRIWKLYGTVATKGDSTPDRPHRLSRLLHVPDPVQVVSSETLAALAALAPAAAPFLGNFNGNFNVGQWLQDHDIAVLYEDANFSGKLGPGKKWVLERCVWNPDHTDKSAFVIQFDSGPIAAGCQHNSCAGKTWKDLRAVVEGQTTQIAGPDLQEEPHALSTSAHANVPVVQPG